MLIIAISKYIIQLLYIRVTAFGSYKGERSILDNAGHFYAHNRLDLKYLLNKQKRSDQFYSYLFFSSFFGN